MKMVFSQPLYSAASEKTILLRSGSAPPACLTFVSCRIFILGLRLLPSAGRSIQSAPDAALIINIVARGRTLCSCSRFRAFSSRMM
jgi:hypothetical protein